MTYSPIASIGGWAAVRLAVLIADEFTCQGCKAKRGGMDGVINVHHCDSDRDNNNHAAIDGYDPARPVNLITLCPRCHAYVHHGMWERGEGGEWNRERTALFLKHREREKAAQKSLF